MRLRALLLVFLATAVAATAAHGAGSLSIFTIAGPGSLKGPQGLAIGPDGSLYIADTIDQRIKRLDPNGRLTTVAGNGRRGFTGDGGPAKSASFQDPTALAVGPDGSIYVTDTANSRVRAIRPDGTVQTIAGTAEQGFSGDGGPAAAAQVDSPQGIAVDSRGRVFFSDTGNDRVRFIDTDGTIHSLAAQLKAPLGLAFAADGSLVVADSGDDAVKRISPGGLETTLATGLSTPADVAVGAGDVVYVVEPRANRVRRIEVDGRITRVAGTGDPRYGGDGRSPASAYLNAPDALELTSGEILIADTDNDRVRYVTVPGQSSRLAIAPLKTSIRLPLFKKKVVVKKRQRRILVVSDRPITWRVTKAASLRLRIATKKGKLVSRLKTHAAPGAGAFHLPARLRSGRHRLVKGHYVVGVTATSGTATARTNLELVVK